VDPQGTYYNGDKLFQKKMEFFTNQDEVRLSVDFETGKIKWKVNNEVKL
jgi:hypothetical protein